MRTKHKGPNKGSNKKIIKIEGFFNITIKNYSIIISAQLTLSCSSLQKVFKMLEYETC